MRYVDSETGEPVPVHVVEAAMADHQYQVTYTFPGEDGHEPGAVVPRGRRPPGSPYGGFWQNATQGMTTPEEDGTPEEDALIALGKMMRDGAKFLWRKVSKGGKGAPQASTEEGKKEASDGEKDNGEESDERPRIRRSASEPAQQTRSMTGSDSSEDTVTLRIEFTEPRHCFSGSTTNTPPPSSPSHASATLDVPVPTEETAAPRLSKEEEVGRVWEERVGDDVTRRLEAIAREKEKDKDKDKDKRKSKLVNRLANRAPAAANGKAKA